MPGFRASIRAFFGQGVLIHRSTTRILLAAAALLAAPATAHATSLNITANPPLYPAFKPAIRDYVSRCDTGTRLELVVRVPSRSRASVDGGRVRHTSFRRALRLRAGQQTVVHTRRGDYRVRCLPPRFPTWTSQKSGPTQASYYLVTPSGDGPSRWLAMFDPNGVPIWWLREPTATIDARLLPNGHVTWSRYYEGDILGERNAQAYIEQTLTGRRVRAIQAVGSPTDIHDMRRMRNGHSLVITYRKRAHADLRSQGGPADATVLDGVIQELDRRGRVVWSWNSKHHIALAERAAAGPLGKPTELHDGTSAYDIVHLNSVEPHGKRLIVSARTPSAVYEIDRRTGDVVWKLGGTATARSLDVVGDTRPAPHFGGQHDARVLPDGTLTIHDNATGRGLPPRTVRFAIDENARRATLVEQVTDPVVKQSFFGGSARRLAGGDWVVSWGGEPYVRELTPAGVPVFTLQFAPEWYSYRAFPIVRGRLRASTLRHAMNVMHPRR